MSHFFQKVERSNKHMGNNGIISLQQCAGEQPLMHPSHPNTATIQKLAKMPSTCAEFLHLLPSLCFSRILCVKGSNHSNAYFFYKFEGGGGGAGDHTCFTSRRDP